MTQDSGNMEKVAKDISMTDIFAKVHELNLAIAKHDGNPMPDMSATSRENADNSQKTLGSLYAMLHMLQTRIEEM